MRTTYTQMNRTALRLVFFGVIVLLSATFLSAEAATLQWSKNVPNLCRMYNGYKAGTEGKPMCRPSLKSVSAQVSYYTRVTNAETGEVIACGSTVPNGTKVKYEFVPYKYTHITWTRTGNVNDTPYGAWVNNADQPSGERCTSEYYVGRSAGGRTKIYAAFTAAPPTKTISGLPSTRCTTAADGVSKICTLTQEGEVNAQFHFAQTHGRFYYAQVGDGTTECTSWKDLAAPTPKGNWPSRWETTPIEREPYRLQVPAQSTSCIINVEPAPEVPTTPPQRPNLAAAAGACVVGQAYAISMTATDPDGDKVRYLIDWNNDGSADQFVPASGYVNSGAPQTASKTFASAGSKTVRVRAQDDKGASSAWGSMTFSCSGADDSTIVDLNGENEPVLTDDNEPVPTLNDLSLRALPSLVRSGDTTKVHWSSQNMSTCSVSGSNGDSWSGLNSPVNGETSGTISSLTTYTLTCRAGGNTFTKTANVNVLPSWVEK
jgi:hypothetical protein